MKNYVIGVFCFFLLIALSGCKDKNPLNPLGCVGDAQKVSDAASKFAQNQSKANCEAYKSAILSMVKSCPTYYGAIEKQELEEFANTACQD